MAVSTAVQSALVFFTSAIFANEISAIGIVGLSTRPEAEYKRIGKLIGWPEPFNVSAGMPQSALDQYVNDAIPNYFRITQKCFNIRFYLDMLISRIRLGGNVLQIQEMLTSVCTTVGLTTDVCTGLADRFVPTFHYIVRQRPRLNADACTGIIFQQLGCTTIDPYVEWKTDDPIELTSPDGTGGKKHRKNRVGAQKQMGTYLSVGEYDLRARARPLPKVPQRPLKIIHLTDIHIDPNYAIGSNADCENKLLCCHDKDGPPANSSVTAGKYGNSRSCDLPPETFENALKNMKMRHPDVDLLYISGDFVPHNMWYTFKPDNIRLMQNVSKTIRKYFPDTQIIPVLGNHEPHPVNMFSPRNAPEKLSTQWVFNSTEKAWMNWIPPDAAESYVHHHYYSIKINPNFRVLALNTALCFGFNFWQLFSFDDFKLQLRWLRSELQKSLESQEAVHILGHVPPGHIQCSRVFSHNYYDIINKYHSVVKGQFFGHTHVDTFRLFYNQDGHPINAQWVSPSLTPFRSNNPAYKVYYIDSNSSEVIDHETFTFDLEKANASNETEPVWFKLYTATEVYKVPDVKLSNLDLIINEMAQNVTLFHEYYRLHKKGINSKQIQPCQTYCRKRALCRIVTPYFGAKSDCERVQLKVDGAVVPIYYDDPL